MDKQNQQSSKSNLWRRVLAHPFRSYWRVGGATFCIVAVSNTITALFDKDRRDIIQSSPQIFFTGILLKSSYFGMIWPAFYITAVKNPRQTFYLGGGMEYAVSEFNDAVRDVSNEINGKSNSTSIVTHKKYTKVTVNGKTILEKTEEK